MKAMAVCKIFERGSIAYGRRNTGWTLAGAMLDLKRTRPNLLCGAELAICPLSLDNKSAIRWR